MFPEILSSIVKDRKMVKIRRLISHIQRDFLLKRNRYVPNHVLHS